MRYCANCGVPLEETTRFCPACGSGVDTAPVAAKQRRSPTLVTLLLGVSLLAALGIGAVLLWPRGGAAAGTVGAPSPTALAGIQAPAGLVAKPTAGEGEAAIERLLEADNPDVDVERVTDVSLSQDSAGSWWACGGAVPADEDLDGVTVFIRQHGGEWSIVTYGTSIDASEFPEDVRAWAVSNGAEEKEYTPDAGGAERKALMDAAHAATGDKKAYMVDQLHVQGDWAVGWMSSDTDGDRVCAWHKSGGTWKCVAFREFLTESTTPRDDIWTAFSDAGVPSTLATLMDW